MTETVLHQVCLPERPGGPTTCSCHEPGCRGRWRDLGFRPRDEIRIRIAHRISFWLNRTRHKMTCTCAGSGIWT